MRKFAFAALVVAAVSVASAQEVFRAGEGVANQHGGNVLFVQRGGGNVYGYGVGRQYYTPIGLTLIAWDIPNSMSAIYGARFNLGCGRFERTYGADLGLFSRNGEFSGVAANVIGNFCETNAEGLQLGVVNMVEGDVDGVQIGLVNKAGHLRGLQIGIVNFNPSGISFPILNFGF